MIIKKKSENHHDFHWKTVLPTLRALVSSVDAESVAINSIQYLHKRNWWAILYGHHLQS